MTDKLLAGFAPPAQSIEGIGGTDGLFKLLDAEIDHLRRERTRGGWTSWALVIALGTALSLAGAIWEEGGISVPLTALLFALLSVLGDNLVRSFLDPELAPKEGVGRIRVGSYLGWRPAALVLYGARAALVAFSAWYARDVSYAWVAWLIAALYALLAIFLLVVAVVTLKRYPIKRTVPSDRLGMMSAIWTILVGVLVVSYILSLGVLAQGQSWDELRLAVLLVVSLHLGLLLLAERHREPLLESLIEIRRAMVLGDMDAGTAREQVRVVLSGMAAGDWIQPELRRLLESYNRQVASDKAATELARMSYDEVSRLEKFAEQGVADHSIAQSVIARFEPIRSLVTDAGSSYEGVTKSSGAIAGRFGFLISSVPGAEELHNEYKRAIEPVISDSIQRHVQLTQGFESFHSGVIARLRALGY